MTDNQKTPDKKEDVGDIQQDSSVTDKDRKDRPGSTNGQPATNADYDYRPDFGKTGGAVEQDDGKVIDGKPVSEKKPKQEGDKPEDLNKPAQKYAAEKSK